MLCRRCHRLIDRGALSCPSCGALLREGANMLELVLEDGRRFPVVEPLSIGRAPENPVCLSDPTVSGEHARVVPTAAGARLEDAGSSHGTLLDGRLLERPETLRDGSRIGVGDAIVRVERRRLEEESAITIVGPRGPAPDRRAPAAGLHRQPRLRGDWKLKRLEAAEGAQRYVLHDLAAGRHLRMNDDGAALFSLLDGGSTVLELLAESEERLGERGRGCLTQLLADLGDRGLLDDVEALPPPPRGRFARLVGPHDFAVAGVAGVLQRIYRAGGFVLFARPVQFVLACASLTGAIAFAAVVGEGERIPFVVSGSVYAGAPVFLLGRFALVAMHELAHGLAVVAAGRTVARAGLRLVLVFPYAFVDTSEAWFEPRRRRLEITAAGPVSDLTLAGLCSIVTGLAGAGAETVGDVTFQLAVGAYVGALLNLNPCLDRDGYHLLVDLLRQPNLRQRSREELTRALAGRPAPPGDRRAPLIYGAAAMGWSLLGAAFAAWMAGRYASVLREYVPVGVVWLVLGLLVAALVSPIVVVVARPLIERANRRGNVRSDEL